MLGMFWESVRNNPGPLIGFLFTLGTLCFILLFAHETDHPALDLNQPESSQHPEQEGSVTDTPPFNPLG